MELEALQKTLPEIEKTGTLIVAISPLQQKYAGNLMRNLGLSFPLLLDPGNLLAKQFRMAYQGLGIDLECFNGNNSWEMPLPKRFAVDRDGTIIDAALHPNHTRRPEPEETLEILRKLTS